MLAKALKISTLASNWEPCLISCLLLVLSHKSAPAADSQYCMVLQPVHGMGGFSIPMDVVSMDGFLDDNYLKLFVLSNSRTPVQWLHIYDPLNWSMVPTRCVPPCELTCCDPHRNIDTELCISNLRLLLRSSFHFHKNRKHAKSDVKGRVTNFIWKTNHGKIWAPSRMTSWRRMNWQLVDIRVWCGDSWKKLSLYWHMQIEVIEFNAYIKLNKCMNKLRMNRYG